MKKDLKLLLTFYNFIYRENRGDQIRGGRPNSLADLVPHGPGGLDPLADLDPGDQIRGGTGSNVELHMCRI